MTDDDDLRAEVRELRSEVDALQHRLGRLESILDSDTLPEEQHTQERESDRTHARKQHSSDPAPESPPSRGTCSRDHAPADANSDAGDIRETDDDRRNWERDIGTKWLGRVGSVALVLGVVFFIRVAIEAGILGPFGRVAAGTVAGTALLAGGRYAARRRGYRRWGRITAGTGLARHVRPNEQAIFPPVAPLVGDTYREREAVPACFLCTSSVS
jgi:uncharacterized membrane protein